jgi:hypothetical protein
MPATSGLALSLLILITTRRRCIHRAQAARVNTIKSSARPPPASALFAARCPRYCPPSWRCPRHEPPTGPDRAMSCGRWMTGSHAIRRPARLVPLWRRTFSPQHPLPNRQQALHDRSSRSQCLARCATHLLSLSMPRGMPSWAHAARSGHVPANQRPRRPNAALHTPDCPPAYRGVMCARCIWQR